ncbi:MAG: T9SS type A sorting domain-containing protein, partial [Chitinophagales bacterium]|nr:T9SS type A sorting domain-containing protein [Chitinophagales bacterium]
DDNCRTMFTKGQAEVMYNQIVNGQRSSFKNALSACFYETDAAVKRIVLPTDTICNLNFRPVVRVKNEGMTVINSGTIFYRVDNGNFIPFNLNQPLGIQEEAFITLPVINVSEGDHTLTISFEKPNNKPQDDNTSNDLLSINFYAYDGGFSTPAPFKEDFEFSSFPPANWNIDNRGTPNTWDLAGVSAYDQGNYSIFINNLNYNSNPSGTRDALITEDYDVSQIGLPNLKFDYAYCRVNSNRFDSLIVYYSLDCGERWTPIFRNGGITLATAPDRNTLFTPTADQWKTVHLTLPFAVGQNKVRFKFENICGWGNALYLDNINVFGTPQTQIREEKNIEVKVYPNPVTDLALVSLPVKHPFTTAEIYNALGQKISTQKVFQSIVEIQTHNLANGPCYIHLSGEGYSQVVPIVVNKR